MSDNVIDYPGMCKGPLPVDAVCEGAKKKDFVLIIGLKDGKVSVAYSDSGNIYECLGIMERARSHLLSILEDETGT